MYVLRLLFINKPIARVLAVYYVRWHIRVQYVYIIYIHTYTNNNNNIVI